MIKQMQIKEPVNHKMKKEGAAHSTKKSFYKTNHWILCSHSPRPIEERETSQNYQRKSTNWLEIKQKYQIHKVNQMLRMSNENKCNSWSPRLGHLLMLSIWLTGMSIQSLLPKVQMLVFEKAPWRSSRYHWCQRTQPSKFKIRDKSPKKAMVTSTRNRWMVIG